MWSLDAAMLLDEVWLKVTVKLGSCCKGLLNNKPVLAFFSLV
jgi:hypothetical protein